MAQNLLAVRISDHARIAYSSLGAEDRRRVDAWFDHLRNWRNDLHIQAKSRRLESDEEMYVLPTSTEFFLAFSISGDEVTVLSILRKDALRTFEALAEPSAT